MLTQEDDVEIHAYAARGWTKAAIARHTGRDRKTVAKYLARPAGAGQGAGAELPGAVPRLFGGAVRGRPARRRDRAAPRAGRCRVRSVRIRRWCGSCGGWSCGRSAGLPAPSRAGADGRDRAPGRGGDPVGLAGAARHAVGRAGVRARRRAVALGPVSGGVLRADDLRSSRRAVHTILVELGGTSRVWRTDRMATIVIPGTDRLTVDAANLAKHYGVEIAVCPPRRAQRKGVVEKADAVPDTLVVAHCSHRLAGRSADVAGSLERRGRRLTVAVGWDGRRDRRC